MASGVNFNAVINLKTKTKANVSPLVSGTKKVGTAFQGLKKAAAEGSAGTYVLGGTMSAVKNAAKNLVAALPALITAIGTKLVASVKKAYSSFKSLVKEGMELAKVQYAVENKVSTVFGGQNLDAIKAEASRVQGLGIIGDEKLMQAAVSMGAAGLSTEDTIRMMEGVADLAVAKTEDPYSVSEGDMQTIGDAVAKAVVNGNVRSLAQYLPDLDKAAFSNASATERLDMIYEALEASNIRGMNANLAETDQGKTTQVENEIGDVKEEIGKYGLRLQRLFYETIRPYLPVLQEIGEWIMSIAVDALNNVADYLSTHQERIKYYLLLIATKVKNFVDKLDVPRWIDSAINTFDFISKDLPNILKLILGTLAVIAGSKAIGGFATFATSVGGVSVMNRTLGHLFGEGIAKAKQLFGLGNAMAMGEASGTTAAKHILANGTFFERAIVRLGSMVTTTTAFALQGILGGIISFLIAMPALIVGKIVEWLNEKFQWNQRSSKAFNATIGEFLVNHGIGTFDDRGVLQLGSHALGTPYTMPNTTTTINERGGEIMRTPAGTTIIPADKSAALLNGGKNITVNVNVAGNVIGNRQFLDEVGTHVVRRLQTAMVSI